LIRRTQVVFTANARIPSTLNVQTSPRFRIAASVASE
jgi:hypothetical protein